MALQASQLSAGDFGARVLPALLGREAENNLLLGIAQFVAAAPERAPNAVLLALEAAGVIVAAAVRTPPHDIVVTRLPEGGAAVVATHFAALPAALTGVAGPEGAGLAVAEELVQRLGGTAQVRIRQRIYSLTRLNEVAPAPGAVRLATSADQELVRDWYLAFGQEVRLAHPGDAAEWVKLTIDAGKAWLWQDGAPQALACLSRGTPHGRGIGPVYTPPASRRKGYATALVAELSRRVLTSGKRFACLFTDDANPTSNHIYETIGFEFVCRFDAYTLDLPRERS